MFGMGKKKEPEKKPEVKIQLEETWNDKIADAMPKQSLYYDAIRTDAYESMMDSGKPYLQWYAALKIDAEKDTWRIMQYVTYQMDKPDGQFHPKVMLKSRSKDEAPTSYDCGFAEAVATLARHDSMQRQHAKDSPDIKRLAQITEEMYPADKSLVMQTHYFDIENYRTAAAIHGIAFDELDRPFRTLNGKVFADARFMRSEIEQTLRGPDMLRSSTKLAPKIEGGILSDIFHSAASREASLEGVLKVGKTLACLDKFVEQIGAFYIGVQKMTGLEEKFDKINALPADDRNALYQKLSLMNGRLSNVTDALAGATVQLEEAKTIGIHTEPFEKFVAECELYYLLLTASQNLKKLKDGITKAGGADADLIISIQKSVNEAKEKFRNLGGAEEQFDRLQAWVANSKKDVLPPWLPGFIDRYYDQRRKVMLEVQKRQVTAAATMSVKVKPPVTE